VPDRVLAVTADVSRPEGVQQIVGETVRRFGGIDVLVNNVGLGPRCRIDRDDDAEWQEAFDQTLLPAVRASRLAVPHMRARGGGRSSSSRRSSGGGRLDA
jgi:3-oxoacyl-[acyl-carrier protein] reductase